DWTTDVCSSVFLFFFSSRRRHTSFSRDWSSDVCSSDLLAIDLDVDELAVHEGGDLRVGERLALHHVTPVTGRVADRQEDRPVLEIGRASCRERSESSGVAGSLRKQDRHDYGKGTRMDGA